jgi:hypothetical protein
MGRPRRALDDLLDGIEDSIADQDRFRIVPIAGLPADSAGFTYYAWRNSPLLIDKFFFEWTLGLFIAIQNGEFVIMHDTEGLVLDTSGLSLKAASRRRMELAFPEASNARPSRLTRMSFASLDMSSQAIRTMSMRTRSFETTFTDLLDPHLVPTAAAGFVNRRARYIGFARARFRDSNPRVGLQSYIDWTRQVAGQLRANAKASPVFGRYAKLRDDIDEDGAQPQTILLSLSRDDLVEETPQGSEARRLADDLTIDHDDLCADVDDDGKFEITVLGKKIECTVEYNPSTRLYRFHSEQLNALFERQDRNDGSQPQTASQRIASQQSFRINVAEPKIV